MVEMVVTLIVISVVAVTTVAGLADWYNSNKDQGYQDDAEGIIKAYHEWYGVNVGKIASETAEQALYDFVVQKNGISFYNYDNLKFNYTFKDDEESGEKKAYLLYDGTDYACSIALDVVRMSATNDLEAFHLSYTDGAYAEISKDYSSTLFNIGVNERDTVLGVYNNNIGRKAVKMVITHEQTDDLGNNIVETLYVRPNRYIQTTSYNKTVYEINNSVKEACMNIKGRKIENLNSYKSTLGDDYEATEFVENADLDGYDNGSNIVVCNDEDWLFNDGGIANNLSQFGVVIKFTKHIDYYDYGHTDYYERTISHSRGTYWKRWLLHAEKFPAFPNASNESLGTYVKKSEKDSFDNYRYTNVNYVMGFDSLKESLNFIYGSTSEFKSEVNNFSNKTNQSGLYGTYVSAINNTVGTPTYSTVSTSYSGLTGASVDDEIKIGKSGYLLKTRTVVQSKSVVYRTSYTQISFLQNSFEMYLGTCTIDKNTVIPSGFKLNLPFNYAYVNKLNSNSIEESNRANYGRDYYLNNSSSEQTYVSSLYRTYQNTAYTEFKETNRITINEGVTLDCSNAKLIVGGLMLPNKEGFNSKLNVGNHAAIYNNGKIILGSQGLECYGFIYGNGTIERKSGVSQTTIKERSSMLDYTNDADVNTRFMSKKFGGKWPKTNNKKDVSNFLKDLFNGIVDSSSDFQQAYIAHSACEMNRNIDEDLNWAKIIGQIDDIVDSSQGGMIKHDYIETDKPYSMPMIMKYDSTAIQCTLKLNANDKYIQKYFVYSSTINQFYDFDYNLFGQSYDTFNDESMDSANLESKMKSAIFNIQTGTLYKTVSASGKMIFETSNARVVNNDNFTYWAYFDSIEHYSVSGSFAPVALYNTEFNFSGTSSLDVNCSDLWVLPSAKLSFSDSARLGVGSKSDVKGYCDIWTSPGYAKRYTAHGNIAMFSASDLYKEINISRNVDKELLSYNSLENGKLVYTSSVTPTILDNSNVAGDIYCNMNKFGIFMSHSYDYSCSYMPRYGEGNRDLGSGNWIYSIEANCMKL